MGLKAILGAKLMGWALASAMDALKELITRENYVALVDGIFDFIEDYVQQTDNTIDDVVVLPVIQRLRVIMEIPDNDNIVINIENGAVESAYNDVKVEEIGDDA